MTDLEMREITRNFVRGVVESKISNESKILNESIDPREELMMMELESRSKIIKGLEMAGIDPNKLKDLPAAGMHMKALLSMINQAIDTTIAGKGVAAQKRTARAVKDIV